ncbi:hypothetical protein NDU88_002429 [Pleurodeles waltl]|uniref:Uncharacterized protein n=1 Tax=Pleurodeles waltl TaxID=8319 RepID=A0AAV7SBX9_PLEWA|nr:hypothetical protein NDU88_002429 [Pleurodeles waltl]
MTYIATLLHLLRGDGKAPLPELERAHWVAAALNCSGGPPDTLTQLYYYTEKEAILKAMRAKTDLNFRGNSIQLFQDLSPITVRRHHDFKLVTDKLHTMNVRYQWGHPFVLLFICDGKRRAIRSLTEDKQLLDMSSPDCEGSASPCHDSEGCLPTHMDHCKPKALE